MLQWAHAVEIGAFYAYEGHWRSLPNDSVPQNTIKAIQIDEKNHKEALEVMLKSLNAKPSKLQDAMLWCIGRFISASCYFIGYKAAMFGAKIMEIMGSKIYWKLAIESTNSGHQEFHSELCSMARMEEDHERFIKICLTRTSAQSQQSQNSACK